MSMEADALDRSTTTPPRRPRRPWILAGVAALVLIIGATAVLAVAFLAQERDLAVGPTRMAGSLPADTVVYLELDLEPDGAQGEALAALGARFGDADAAPGIAALLDPLIAGFTDGGYDYERDVATWFDGHAAFAVLDWGSVGLGGLLTPLPGDPVAPGAVVLLGVEDREAATALTDRLRADARAAGFGFVSREIDGWTVWRADAGPGQPGVAFAVGDELLVLGVSDVDIETIIDLQAEGGETLASDADFRGEVARLPAERVATLYSRAEALRGSLIGTVGVLGLGDLASARLLAGLLPLDLVGSIVLEPDRVIVERWQPAGPHQPGDRTTDRSAELVPAAVGLYAELPEFGRLLSALGDAVGDDVRGQGLREVDLEVARFEAAIGRPIGEVGDWLGDVALAVAVPDDTAQVGLTGLAVDEEAAAEVLDGFTAWLAQAGVPVRQAEVAGRPVVTIDVPFLFGSITLEYALADDVLLLGVEGFIEWVASGERFLVDDPDYGSALDEIDGRQNAGVVYLPIARWLEGIEANGADPFGDDPIGSRLAQARDAIMVTFDEDERVRSRLEIRFGGP